MHDAEMLLGMHRHLTAYAVVPATSALGGLQFAGKLYEMAFRLRGSGVSSLKRFDAIAISAGIPALEARMMLLPTLETLGWLRVNRNGAQIVISIEDVIPPVPELLALADNVMNTVAVDETQRAAMAILRASTLHPLERVAALQAAASFGDEEAEAALRHLEAVNLVKVMTAEDGRSAVFNPNVWTDDQVATTAALKIADSRMSSEVAALMEEIQSNPGIPQGQVTSTEEKWIDFAVSQGLVQRTVVATANEVERKFLFTPHLGHDTFGVPVGDVSGHVRQLVGSMIFAMTYPNYKLRSGAVFVSRLIANGRAGNASPIGTDYPMLETAGIVTVVPGDRAGFYSLELRQTDVAEAALRVLQSRTSVGTAMGSSSGLMGQNAYRHLEAERAQLQLAVTNPIDTQDRAQLIAALRQASRGAGS